MKKPTKDLKNTIAGQVYRKISVYFLKLNSVIQYWY